MNVFCLDYLYPLKILVIKTEAEISLPHSQSIDQNFFFNFFTINITYLYLTGSVDFANPAYENIAPCPCDVTLERCDISCCCDSVCFVYVIKVFT